MEEKQVWWRELFNKHHEIIMYCVFGVTTTLVSWGTYWLFMLILPFDFDVCVTLFGREFEFVLNIVIANVISWIIAVSVAFVTNKIWVFESKSWEKRLVWGEAVTFIGGRMLTGAIEILALPLLVGLGLDQTLFGVEGFPAKILLTVCVVILNYILSKFISFNLQDKLGSDNQNKTDRSQK
ncbi:MAG: GtrA family protein [Clostridia bacterium]|nr:GtrA family protein [Clostridia bacterium]